MGLAKAHQVHLETGDKHQQQLPHVREEIGNRPLLAKHAHNMGTDKHAAEQQTHYCREPDAARQRRDAENKRHAQGEFRQRRQRQSVSSV